MTGIGQFVRVWNLDDVERAADCIDGSLVDIGAVAAVLNDSLLVEPDTVEEVDLRKDADRIWLIDVLRDILTQYGEPLARMQVIFCKLDARQRRD